MDASWAGVMSSIGALILGAVVWTLVELRRLHVSLQGVRGALDLHAHRVGELERRHEGLVADKRAAHREFRADLDRLQERVTTHLARSREGANGSGA